MSPRVFRWSAFAVIASYALVLLIALPSAPLTDDDDFYLPAGRDYAAWLGRVVTLDFEALSRREIEAAFDANHEHPPMAKYALGVAGAAFSPWLGPISGPRVGTIVFAVLAAAMVLWMSVSQLGRARGLAAGGLGVLFLLLLPRYFFHARVATLDVPVAAMYVASAALALRAERAAWAAWAVGPVFGLAAATKLNAPFLVAPYLVYALLVRGGSGRTMAGSEGRSVPLFSIPSGAISMAVLGPLTFFAVWPWMWFSTARRVTEYVNFHLQHYGIYFLYFGRLYEKDPFAPWHMPFVMAGITVPLAISVLAAVGLGFGSGSALYRIYLGHAAWGVEGEARVRSREGELILFCALNAFFTLATVAFSGGAKYAGAKLFMPFYPFWCLLAGYGALRLFERARTLPYRWAPAVVATAVGVAGLSSLAHLVRFRAVPLSQYNAWMGGLRGATAEGFERQYYDLAFRDLVAFLSEKAPERARIHFLPNNWEYVRTFKWYRREGTLREDIQVVRAEAQANWVVLTHERRFRRYGEDLRRVRGWEVIEERRVDGVPLWTVLQRTAKAGSSRP